jgi:hypothetical protein
MIRILKRYDRVRACHNLIAFEEQVSLWLVKSVGIHEKHFGVKIKNTAIDVTNLLKEGFGQENLMDETIDNSSVQLTDLV